MKIAILMAALAMSGASAMAQVYQCAGPGGQKVFQQAPCSADAQPMDVKPVPKLGGTFAAGINAAEVEHRYQVRRAIEEGRVIPGMTESEMVSAIGHPARINTTASSSGTRRQLIYPHRDGTAYHYTENGRLTTSQYAEGYSRPRRSCPSSIDIQNLETSAKVDAQSPEERRARWAAVEAARSCQP